MSLAEQLLACRVLPVVTAIDVESTVQLVHALGRAGMNAVEITLRTPAALDSIRAVRKASPDTLVAVGTVTSANSLEKAMETGADIYVSPGITETLLSAAADLNAPLLPGVASASDVMLGVDHGLDLFKLFPAVPVGGVALLKALAGPFPEVRFCPTGGLGPDNFTDFLALPNVVCCGGSWMVAEQLVRGGDWDTVEAIAREAIARAMA